MAVLGVRFGQWSGGQPDGRDGPETDLASVCPFLFVGIRLRSAFNEGLDSFRQGETWITP